MRSTLTPLDQSDAGNAGFAPRSQIVHPWPGVREPRRSASFTLMRCTPFILLVGLFSLCAVSGQSNAPADSAFSLILKSSKNPLQPREWIGRTNFIGILAAREVDVSEPVILLYDEGLGGRTNRIRRFTYYHVLVPPCEAFTNTTIELFATGKEFKELIGKRVKVEGTLMKYTLKESATLVSTVNTIREEKEERKKQQ